MATELVTMSTREIDCIDVVRRVVERRLTQDKAGQLIGLTGRQVRRLCVAYERDGPTGLVSRQRGRPSNHRLPEDLRARAIAIVRERYTDFGPKLANEKLLEIHEVRVSQETLRHWLVEAGIWLPKAQRVLKVHQPRQRRQCFGELVQIEGSPHAWFEERPAIGR